MASEGMQSLEHKEKRLQVWSYNHKGAEEQVGNFAFPAVLDNNKHLVQAVWGIPTTREDFCDRQRDPSMQHLALLFSVLGRSQQWQNRELIAPNFLIRNSICSNFYF